MQPKLQEGLIIVGLAALASFVPALVTGSSFAAAHFALAFAGLFILPMTPWVLMLERSTFEKFVLALILGAAAMPIAYFIIGVLRGPLNLWVFVGIALLVFAIGLLRLRKSQAR